jgi:hypothetical protein
MKSSSSIALVVAFGLAPLSLSSQGGCAADTGSKRFAFEALAGGSSEASGAPLTFENEKGWTVTLTKATVTLGPVYLNVVAPLTDQKTSLLDFLIRPAWAHGEAHLESGRIVGEVLSQVTFDALSPALVPFSSLGTITREECRTAEVWLYPEPGISPNRTKIDTIAFDVAGTASRAGESVPFRGALVLDDTWVPDQVAGTRGAQTVASIRKVRGIPASFFPNEGGRLEIRFDVSRLFRGANFENLADNPTDADGRKVLVQSKGGRLTTDQVMQNLYQGMREANGTYAVRWAEP